MDKELLEFGVSQCASKGNALTNKANYPAKAAPPKFPGSYQTEVALVNLGLH
jgi:hypothetical protein